MLARTLLTAALISTAALSRAARPPDLAAGLAEAERLAKTGDFAGAADAAAPLIERASAEWGPSDDRTVRAVGARASWARLAGRPGQVREARLKLAAVKPPTTASQLELARIARLDGDPAGAAALAEKTLPAGGEGAFLELSLCREAQGRFEDAAAALRLGLAAHPRSALLRIRLAHELRRAGAFEEAMRLYDEAREFDPSHSGTYYEEGYARQFSGQEEAAARVFEAEVSASSGSPISQHHLAMSLWFRGMREQGLESMQKTAALFESHGATGDDYAHALIWLATMVDALKRPGEEAFLLKAVSVTLPGSKIRSVARVKLAHLRTTRGKHPEALRELDEAQKECARFGCAPTAEASIWVQRANTERAGGDLASARRAADRARDLALRGDATPALSTGRVSILVQCSRFYRGLGDLKAARAVLEAAAKLAAASPNHPTSVKYRRELDEFEAAEKAPTAAARPPDLAAGLAEAERLAKTGDFAGAADAAAPLIERASAEWGPSDDRTVRAVGARASWARLAGRPAQVREARLRLESVKPPTAASLLERARILRLDGDPAGAAGLAEKALSSGGESAFLELARCREAQGRIEDAAAILRRGLASHPRSAGLLSKLADILRRSGRSGDLEEAARLYAAARAADPGMADALILEGYSRLYAGEWDQADHIFESLVESSTSDAMAHLHRGTSLWMHGELDRGLAEMETARRLAQADRGVSRDDYAHSLRWLAAMHERMGRTDSEALLREALNVASEDSTHRYQSHAHLAKVLTQRGDYAGARGTLDAGLGHCAQLKCSPLMSGMLWSVRSAVEVAASDAAAARRAAAQARAAVGRRTNPPGDMVPRVKILLECVRAYQALGDLQEVRAALEEAAPFAAALPETHPIAVNFQRTREELDPTREKSPPAAAIAHRDRGASLWAEGALERGLAELERARSLFEADPRVKGDDYADVLMLLAEMNEHFGRPDSEIEKLARKALTAASAGSPQRYRAYEKIGNIMTTRGERLAPRPMSDAGTADGEQRLLRGRIWAARSAAELAAGDAAEARRTADRARETALSPQTFPPDKILRSSMSARILIDCARTYRGLGDGKAARAALAEAAPFAAALPETHPAAADYRRARDELAKAE